MSIRNCAIRLGAVCLVISGAAWAVPLPPPGAYSLIVNVSPPDAGTSGPISPWVADEYAAGTVVCLGETPNSGYLFSMWSGVPAADGGPGVGDNCLTMNADATVTANFVPLAGPSGVNNRSFVSTGGNDANSCAVTAPCRTLARALAMTNGGGEIIVMNAGSYDPVGIAQPVTISATGIDASIEATDGYAIAINTPGNVTLQGLGLHGLEGGYDGVDVQQVGVLRLYDITAESFLHDGVEMGAAGDLTIYDSRFTDNGRGVELTNGSASVYIRRTSLDDNQVSGVLSEQGIAVVTNSSAHFNGDGFTSGGGTLVLARDRAALNYDDGIDVQNPAAYGQFAFCSVALNSFYSHAAFTGGTVVGTSPGTTLAMGAAGGTALASPTALR